MVSKCKLCYAAPMKIQTEASKTIAQRLSFQTAVKDQAGIAAELAAGQEVSEIYHPKNGSWLSVTPVPGVIWG